MTTSSEIYLAHVYRGSGRTGNKHIFSSTSEGGGCDLTNDRDRKLGDRCWKGGEEEEGRRGRKERKGGMR